MKLRYLGLCICTAILIARCLFDWDRPVHWEVVFDRWLGVIIALLSVWFVQRSLSPDKSNTNGGKRKP